MKWNLLFVFGLFGVPAHAAVIRYAFAGQLDYPLGTFDRGTPFSGEFSYEQNQSTTLPPPGEPQMASYVAFNLTLIIGGSTFDVGLGAITIHNDSAQQDSFELRSKTFTGPVGGLPLMMTDGVMLVLADKDGSLWNGLALPGSGLTLADFDGTRTLLLGAQGAPLPSLGSLSVLQSIPVPEPSGAMLSGAGLLLLIRRRRGSAGNVTQTSQA